MMTINATATAIIDGRRIAGRVDKLSLGAAVFAGPLSAPAGTIVELEIAGIDRVLKTRFVEVGEGGSYLQLPLNHAHLTYMGQVLSKRAKA
jgi:hypothetical protein